MKKLFIASLIFCFGAVNFVFAQSTARNDLKGRILLQVEQNGEAWYVSPDNGVRYFMGRPNDAFTLMRQFGVGITDANLNKIQIGGANFYGDDMDKDGLPDGLEDSIGSNANSQDTDGDGYDDKTELINGYSLLGPEKLTFDINFSKSQAGKILLQVEQNGEAWYVNPVDNKRYFLGKPNDAFQIMHDLGLGITDNDLNEIMDENMEMDDIDDDQISQDPDEEDALDGDEDMPLPDIDEADDADITDIIDDLDMDMDLDMDEDEDITEPEDNIDELTEDTNEPNEISQPIWDFIDDYKEMLNQEEVTMDDLNEYAFIEESISDTLDEGSCEILYPGMTLEECNQEFFNEIMPIYIDIFDFIQYDNTNVYTDSKQAVTISRENTIDEDEVLGGINITTLYLIKDNDGLWKLINVSDYTTNIEDEDGLSDNDHDGIKNKDEICSDEFLENICTPLDPDDNDVDNDSWWDGIEVQAETDPKDPTSQPL